MQIHDFHFVTVYTPNSSSGLKRLPFRKEWDAAFRGTSQNWMRTSL